MNNETKLENSDKNKIDKEHSDEEKLYLNSLSLKEYKSYLIAKSHLGSSFGLSKSIGFISWCKVNISLNNPA